jgi:hypothetical protein
MSDQLHDPVNVKIPTPSARPNRQPRDPITHRFLPCSKGDGAANLTPKEVLAELDHRIEPFLAGAISDEGGESEVPTRMRTALERQARLARRIHQLDFLLERDGLIDRRGRLRVHWLATLARLCDASLAIDRMLGFERQAKPIASRWEYSERERRIVDRLQEQERSS